MTISRIIQYFTRGRIETYKYSVEDAINAGYLSHYIYTPILVHLSESDFNSYRSYTKQLLYALNEEPRDQKKITDILTKRSSIVKKSNSKIEKLSQMISQQGTNSYDFRNAVVYCGHGKDYETYRISEKISVGKNASHSGGRYLRQTFEVHFRTDKI